MTITLTNKTKPFKPLTLGPVSGESIRLLGEPLVINTRHWMPRRVRTSEDDRLDQWLEERDLFQPDRMD